MKGVRRQFHHVEGGGKGGEMTKELAFTQIMAETVKLVNP